MKDYFEVTQDDVDNAYKAGAQSQQAKIDELQARVNKALTQVNNHKHSCEARKRLKHMSASASEIAEIEAHESNMYVLENILKGNKYD